MTKLAPTESSRTGTRLALERHGLARTTMDESYCNSTKNIYGNSCLILPFEFELRSERDKIPLWSPKQILILINTDNRAYRQYQYGVETAKQYSIDDQSLIRVNLMN